MRLNMPVTHRECELPDGAILLSETDLEGCITHCNPAFVEASGFAHDELIGQPHNVLRHPGMPAEVFRDLWKTLDLGFAWSAVVKNRRKDGDHYWVMTQVAPVIEGGQPTGYLSVCSRPTREQIAAAESMHASLLTPKAQGAGGAVLRRGQPQPTAPSCIGQVVHMMDRLMFQINILALDVSVEAARTGEQGGRLTAVAAEVLQLARSTVHAAEAVRDLDAVAMQNTTHGTSRSRDA